MNIAIQGDAGSFHDEAARKLYGNDISLVACESFRDVFAAVADGAAETGVVAVENSLYGSLHETYDMILKHKFPIIGEITLAIHQQLIGFPGATKAEITEVYSHPAALDQCRNYLEDHFPNADIVEYYDTAAAVEHIKQSGLLGAAAIASKRAAETLCASYVAEYGADVVIARPSHTYGPHFTETDNRVYAQFIRNVLRDEDIVMKSEGRQFRSWCYVVDCATALLYILLKGTSGEAYNIADNTSNVSIRELAELVADIGGRKVVVQLDDPEAEAQRSSVSRAVFDTSKLQALGWSIGGTLREKMAATIAMQKGK